MQFRILGPLEAHDDRGVLALGGAKPRAVLAILLLHANQPVSAEHLAVALWGDDVPANTVRTVHVHVSRLRKALGGGDVIATTPAGYQLRVLEGELDADRFATLLADGQRALADGRAQAAAAALHEALALWHGPALADFTFESFAQREISGLEEDRLNALEARVEADLAVGRHASLIGELQQLTVEHPTRERFAEYLVVALYRSGRQADALAAFRAARARLVDEHGIEPGRQLRALEAQVLAHDPELDIVVTAPSLAVVTAAPEPERTLTRRTVTVLVATLGNDFKTDPELTRRLIKRGRDQAVRIIEAHGGHYHRGIGSEVVGLFGLSLANEDDSLRALQAAIDLRTAMTDLAVHAGVDTGEVVAEGLADDLSLFGDPLEGAVALARSAPDGEILLSDRTRQLAVPAIRVERLDPVTFRLEALVPDSLAERRRFATPMVGRDDELALTLAAFRRTATSRTAELFTIVADPGLGKTRLAEEFRTRVADDATILVAYCRAYGAGGALAPLAEALTEFAGARSIRQLLEGTDDADAIADLALAGLGLAATTADPEAVPWALRQLLAAIAHDAPLVLIVEDVHAAELPLLELIEHCAEWLTGTPLFVLGLARPEFLDRRAGWIGGRRGVSTLTLSPLTEDAAAQLLQNLIDERDVTLPAPALLGAAEGNPLFIEQLFAMRAEDPQAGRRIPATIQALLAARLDRLSTGERAVIQRAAVIGRQFAAGAVTHLLPETARPAAGRHLRELVHRGLITPEQTRFAGNELMRFHHILIRDVAYAVCPKEERGRVHEAYAELLDANVGGPVGDIDETVGFHLERAVGYRRELGLHDARARELASRAAERLEAAGRSAVARGDAGAASRLLRRSVLQYEAAGRDCPDVLLALGSALSDSGDWQAAGPVLESAVATARHPALEAHARVELSQLRLFTVLEPDRESMQRIADAALDVFERAGDHSGLARAWVHIACLHWSRLDIVPLEEALLRSLDHSRMVSDTRELIEAYNILLRATVVGPCPVGEGVRRCERARADAGEVASLADAIQAVLEAMRESIDVARRLYRGAHARLEEFGLGARLAGLQIYAAMAELIAGDPALIEEPLERACAELERIGERGRHSTALAVLARVRFRLGAEDEALRLTLRSEELSGVYDTSTHIIWSGTRGRVLARRGQPGEAERLARMGVSIARATSADYLTAEALTDLADVLAVNGRADEARATIDEAIALHRVKQNVASLAAAAAWRDTVHG